MQIHINKNEIKLILLLILVLLGIKYKDSIYMPKRKIINELIGKNITLQNTISSIKVGQPDVSKKENENINLKKKLNDIDSQFQKMTVQIPNHGQLDKFLYHLTAAKFSNDIKFTSIKPSAKNIEKKSNETKEKELIGYEKKEFIIEIEGSYSSIFNYINYLETLSQFATISDIKILQNIEKKSNLIEAKIAFNIFISTFSQDKASEFKINTNSEYEKINSPFTTFHVEDNVLKVTVAEEENPQIKVSGIIKANNEYRVIIDEKIYKEGQSINNMVIKKIYNDKIIIESYGKDYEIPIQ